MINPPQTQTACLGFISEPGLCLGASIVVTRESMLRPDTELHLFCDGRPIFTAVHSAEESELKLSHGGKLWILRPWLPGDEIPPAVDDDGSFLFDFWTVEAFENYH